MSVTRKEVEHIAHLAKLKLNEDELEEFTKDLNQILTYVDQLNEVDTSGVEPLSHPIMSVKNLREDELKKSVSQSDALKNSPKHDEEFFLVPKVIPTKNKK